MKRILITGSSEGIGLELARLFALKGNQVTLVARNKEKLEKAVASLKGSGHSSIIADLSKKEEVHKIADHLSASHYDVLINNAGIGMYGRFDEMPYHEQVTMMNLNMVSLTVLSHAFIKQAGKGDALVNIASTLGTTSFPGAAVYAATKAYVTSFSESLWWENKKKGIYVLGFSPGVTATAFHTTSGGTNDQFPKAITQSPQQVAMELFKSLEHRKKPKVVSGGLNRFMLFFQRMLSRRQVVNMMGGFSPIKAA
jgi:uncharacterized protein